MIESGDDRGANGVTGLAGGQQTGRGNMRRGADEA